MSCPFGVIETGKGSFLAIKKKLQFDELVGYLKVSFALLPDYRQGFNTTYSIQDAALGTFSVFFMQCSLFFSESKKDAGN
jgi:hypothetical protein